MNNNEIMETVQLNKKDKETGIVLIFIASLLAFAAAIYGAFRFGKKKGAQQASSCDSKETEEAREKSEERRARSSSRRKKAVRRRKTAAAQSKSERVVYRSAEPQPVYVVRPLDEKKRESRGKRFRRHLCSAAAAILVISMAGSSALQYVEPSTSLAKESFSGIGEIVKKHIDDDDPYVILDIVPGTAVYNGNYPFSLGTMGYLVDGQAPIIDDIANVFRANPGGRFNSYGEREKFVNEVTVSGSELGVTYEERYLGVDFERDNIPSGWMQISGNTNTNIRKAADEEDEENGNSSENQFTGAAYGEDSGDDAGSDSDSTSYVTGRFRGTAKPVEMGKGDYVSLSAYKSASLLDGTDIIGGVGEYYVHNYKSGQFRVVFAPMDYSSEGGYVIVDRIDLDNDAPETSLIYWMDEEGKYHCCGYTIADVLGHDFGDVTGGSSNTGTGNGTVTGNGDGTGEGIGDGTGEGTGEGTGDGTGEGTGDGTGEGTGDGTGESTGDGTGEGTGDGTGEGTGSGTGESGNTETDTGESSSTETDTGEGSNAGIDTDGSDGADDTVRLNLGGGELIVTDPTLMGSLTFSDGWSLLAEDGEEDGGDDGDSEGSAARSKNEIFREQLGNDYTEGRFKVLVFRYEPHPSEGEQLYWPNGVTELDVEPGTPYPYDSYDPVSSEYDENNENNENDEYAAVSYANATDGFAVPVAGVTDVDSGILQFRYVGAGNGDFKLTRDEKNGTLIEVQGAPVYIKLSAGNDWLKKYVFSTLADGDNEDSDFEIEVKTVTASEVSFDDVREADLVYLESGFNNIVLNTDMQGMEVYYLSAEAGDIEESSGNPVVRYILQRAVEDLMPVIVDYDIIKKGEELYEKSNYRYLARAFLKEDLAGFYTDIDDDDDFLENLKMNVGNKERNDNGYHYVNQNVYIVNGSPLVSGDFHDKFDSDAGFRDVIRMIRAENSTVLSKDNHIEEYVSKARAVQYIINFSGGIIGNFDNLRVLEIQPSANTISDLRREDGKKKLIWRTDDMKTDQQILHSNEDFDVITDTKSVVEFNGEWEDINGTYDFIFIGLDGQRLNKNDADETRYNNDGLKGKVYHGGDSSDKGKYDANDLTTQKMEDLLDYMKAGYPVLVESNCFVRLSAQKADNEGDINTDYIDKDSNMFRFLKQAVEDDQYEDCIFTVKDVLSNTMFGTKVSIDKPRLSLVDEEGAETSALQVLERDENNNKYHGQIRYQIKNRGDEEDYSRDTTVTVYVDYNYDGHFAAAEKAAEYTNVDNVLDVEFEGIGRGILPWKLEVSDVENEYRRDSVQGYFVMTDSARDEIKVLQITEKKGDSAYDLQLMSGQNSDSVLGYYLKSAGNVLNADLQFESVKSQGLEDRLTENPKYLEQWDVVVLTLDGAADSSAVAQALTDYVNKGRSLLVCGQDPGDRRAGLSYTLLGQTENERTFVNLGAGNTSEYLRYAGLSSGMFDAQNGLKADEVNNGIISMYPFQISNNTFSFGSSTALKASPYLLEFENQIKSEAEDASFVTVWYTLGSNSRSGSAYGISPKDARNNYYCYSKGNVVYLAQSEYGYTYDSQNGPVTDGADGAAECRFFVNALSAAYSAGLHNAHINIVSGFSPDASDIQTISVPYDDTWLELDAGDATKGILDNTVEVYFRFSDNNFASQKTGIIGFYYEDENGEELPVDGKIAHGTSFASDIWTVIDNKLVQVAPEDLQPGQTYRIKAPVIPLQNKVSLSHDSDEQTSRADIYIVLKTTFVRGNKTYDPIISVDSVSLNRAQLFLLE